MRLVVLGSGTNIPSERAAAGYLVAADSSFVMDMGCGTFRNLSKFHERSGIGHILFTHMHADHYGDFIPFVQNAVHESQEEKRKDLSVFGPIGTKGIIEKILGFSGLGEGMFKTSVKEVSDEKFRIGEFGITAKEVRHVDKAHCLGYRIEHKGRVLAYSGDSRACGELVELCRNADVAVLDCSVPKGFSGRLAEHHLGVTGCGTVAKQAGVKTLVLSHLYPACNGHNLAEECREVFDGKIIVATDLMVIGV